MTLTGGDYQFHCDDCDIDVIVVGFVPTPRPTRCSTCQFIFDHVPEHERDEVRAFLNRDR